jgi:hypothetical protein
MQPGKSTLSVYDLTAIDNGLVANQQPWRFASDHTRFFEAEITWPTVERLTDNNVIEHVDLQGPGSLGQPASRADISIARCRITGWMVVLCGLGSYVIWQRHPRALKHFRLGLDYVAATHNRCAFPARSSAVFVPRCADFGIRP